MSERSCKCLLIPFHPTMNEFNMKPIVVLVFLIIAGCNQTYDKQNISSSINGLDTTMYKEKVIDTSWVHNSTSKSIYENDTLPKFAIDQIIQNGFLISTSGLTQKQYDSISNEVIRTELITESYESAVVNLDTCILIKLSKSLNDTLCNFDDGEYYEKYQPLGLWKERNHLLINFQNWEEQHDYLLNLETGSIYVLAPEYYLSPNRNQILTFTNDIDHAIYGNSFMIAQADNDSIYDLLNLDFGNVAITSADWITDNLLVIEAGIIDQESWAFKEKGKFLMSIKKDPDTI